MLTCTVVDVVERSINTLIYIFGSICVIWVIYQFVRAKQEKQLVCDKSLYYMVLIYGVINVILFMVAAVISGSYCFVDADVYFRFLLFLHLVGRTFYMLQYILLILLLFYRLYFIFKGTTFALSHCSIIIISFSYILFIIVASTFVICYYYNVNQIILVFMMCIILFLVFSLIVGLVWMFAYKLYVVYKNRGSQTNDTKSIVRIITKMFLLTLSSIIFSIVYAIVAMFDVQSNSVHMMFISGILMASHVFINVLSIMFGFKYFGNYYVKICGRFDRQCTICCAKMVAENAGIQLANNQIHSTVSNSASSGTNLSKSQE
eukprot:170997_1